MLSRVGFVALTAALLGTLLMTPTPASAQSCSVNRDCKAGDVCEVTWNFLIFQLRACKSNARCNFDVDCNGGTCAGGGCIAPASSGGVGGGTGPAEGRKCMPKDGSKPPGWATDDKGKPLGACPKGTFCSDKGFCRKLEQ